MTGRFGLRTRLTVFVSVAFALSMTVVAVVAMHQVEKGLIRDTRASAEAVLSEYLESISGGVAVVGVVDGGTGTQFFYRDQDGNQISEMEYFQLIAAQFAEDPLVADVEFGPLVNRPAAVGPAGSIAGGAFFAGSLVMGPEQGPSTAMDQLLGPSVEVVPGTGELVAPDGALITLVQEPLPDGEPVAVDRGDDVVAVSQRMVFGDGTSFEVGVSSPLRPVTDSIDALRNLLFIAVPALILAVTAITWLAATRALAPVQAISFRARAITAERLDERLPVPAAKDEIRELAETVNAMLARLHQSRDRQRQLVADASHELRSPVAASRTQLEVAAANPQEVDWERTAKTVLAEQEHLSELVDDLLALSRLDENGIDRTGPVNLSNLIRNEADRPRAAVGTNATPVPVSVDRSVTGSELWVLGDERLIQRTVRNLLDNGARHAANRVVVGLDRGDDEITVTVHDDGPGVPPQHRETVFERFARLDEARTRDDGGSGLGLAISRDVARAHGGDLTCTRSPLGGARFDLILPVEDWSDS